MGPLLFVTTNSASPGQRVGLAAYVSKQDANHTSTQTPAVDSASVSFVDADADFWLTPIFEIGSGALAGLAVIKGIERGYIGCIVPGTSI